MRGGPLDARGRLLRGHGIGLTRSPFPAPQDIANPQSELVEPELVVGVERVAREQVERVQRQTDVAPVEARPGEHPGRDVAAELRWSATRLQEARLAQQPSIQPDRERCARVGEQFAGDALGALLPLRHRPLTGSEAGRVGGAPLRELGDCLRRGGGQGSA